MILTRSLRVTAFLWTLAFWCAGIGFPLFALFKRVVTQKQSWDLFYDPSILAVVKATIIQAGLSTAISVGIGLFLGLWLGSMNWGRYPILTQSLLSIPQGVPSLVAAAAWVLWLGRTGILAAWGWDLDWAYSLKAVILAHVFFNSPWVMLQIAQARSRIPIHEIEVGTTLGAPAWQRFCWIIWPQVRRTLGSASAQTFGLCTMSFILILILGGGPPVQTLETEIYSRLHFGSLDISGAVVLACWELAITLLPWFCVLWFQGRGLILRVQETSIQDQQTRSSQWVSLFAVGIGAVWVVPYLSILNHPVWMKWWDLGWWSQVTPSLIVSFKLALSSGVLTLLTTIFALQCLSTFLHSPWRTGLVGVDLWLPSGISVLVLSVGFWMAYGNWIDPFEGSLLGLILLQSTLFFPLAFRSLWPLLYTQQTQQLEVAITLGVSPWKAFWLIEWPRWRRPLFSAFGMIAGASLSEVGAASLFSSEKAFPLSVMISRWMTQYRFEDAQALAGVLFILSLITVIGSIYAVSQYRFKAPAG
jgi:thiamine transport system permease protein